MKKIRGLPKLRRYADDRTATIDERSLPIWYYLEHFSLADGRILRAVLVKRNRNYNSATRIVVRTRRIIS
jgi:hypothetical protein